MSTEQTPSGAPQAVRLRRRRWSDPRLVIGLVVVAASVAGVATLVSTADDTVAVWATRGDVRAGEAADVSQLRPVRVRLDDDTRARYVEAEGAASDRFVDGLGDRVWSRSMDEGELVADASLTSQADAGDAEVPLRVERGALPDDLATGDRVDVWVAPQDGALTATDTPGARRVADAVRVLAVGGDGGALGDATATTVLVAVDEAALEGVLGSLGGARVTLVRVPGA